jgi:subtilase family serine protease
VLTSIGLATAGLAGAAPAAASSRTPIAGSHPAWATAHNKVADADPAGKLEFRVYLKLRDQAGAEAAAQAVSSPGSATYRQYLSTSAVRQRFGPTASSVSAVRSWLTSAGFRVTEVAANNIYVQATGTVSQAQQAFAVGLGRYRVDGTTVRAADTDLSVPAPLGSVVSGVVGVDQALSLLRPLNIGPGDRVGGARTKAATSPSAVPPPAGFRNAPPCSAFWAQKQDTADPAFGGGFPNPLPYAPCGYKPGQLRDAYGLSKLSADGSGATVAIVDAFTSPTLYQDAAEYAQRNDPAHPLRASQFSELVFPDNPDLEGPDQCDAAGWYGEQSLDVEAVHAMAPGAHILYVGGADCQDISLDKALNTIVAGNLAQIVSNSYGDLGEDIPKAEVQVFESIAIQAALEGIGLYFSSGDSGDEVGNLGTPSADFSASSPWVTAVGGTSLGIAANGSRVVETGWETGRSALADGTWNPPAPGGYLYGSGGGTSRLFDEPFYQRGVVPTALARQNQKGSKKVGRVVPDISMVGDPNTGMLIGITQTFPDGVRYGEYRIGGTSLSSPLFAGLVAVADQLDRTRHGFVNPALYQLTSRSGTISDVQHQNNGVVRVDYVNSVDASDGLSTTVRSFDFPGLTIHTTPGYDNVTGLGTPAGAAFLRALG